MSIVNMPMPTASRTVASKYDLIFAELKAGTDSAYVERDFVQIDKVRAKLNSAISAYRSRSGDRSAFAVRAFKEGSGYAIGVWKLNHEVTPRKKAA